MKKQITTLAVLLIGLFSFIACGDNSNKADTTKEPAAEPTATDQPEIHGTMIKEGDITVGTPLDQQMVAAGKNIYDMKCQSCHKLTDERVVGPGWKDVTKRRTPVWIMNMVTNVDMMLETDPEAQKLLEQCLVRMPNQNISKDEARQVLEFMRHNDGVK